MNEKQLKRVLQRHKRWANNEPGGERAILVGANMVEANLERANLKGAILIKENLEGAYLDCKRYL